MIDWTQQTDKELWLSSSRGLLATGTTVAECVDNAEIESGYVEQFKQKISDNPCACLWRVGKYEMRFMAKISKIQREG